MLEHHSLLLLPWSAARHRTRAILDADTGSPLGFARRRPAPLPRWLAWLTRPIFDIHEADDAPLLCTLHGPRFYVRAWEVVDAEEHLVGTLRGNGVLDRFGRVLAVVERALDGGFRFPAPDGYEVGSLVPAGGGHRLTFAAVVAGDPFAKMLLLAAALALTSSSPVQVTV